MSDDLIGESMRILTTYKHCKQQAARLRKCNNKQKQESKASFFSSFNQSKQCKREEAAFKTCSREKIEHAIKDLTMVAAKFCPNEVRKFHQCKARTMSDEACEMEDHRAMECAARAVIASAQAPNRK